MKSIGELATVDRGPDPGGERQCRSLQFSIIEALYTRGFTGKDAITALDEADFTTAVAGTVAHQWAGRSGRRRRLLDPARRAPGPVRPGQRRRRPD